MASAEKTSLPFLTRRVLQLHGTRLSRDMMPYRYSATGFMCQTNCTSTLEGTIERYLR